MNKKIFPIILFLIITIAIIGIIVTIIWIQNKQTEEYKNMYDKIANINMSKDDFIARNKNIYEGIESKNIKVENITLEKQGKNYQVNYHETMYTGAGEIQFDNHVEIEKEEKQYKLKWSSSFIFPQLSENQKVRISTIKAKRGEIIDRNNVKLASNGTILSCRNSPTEN